MKSIKIIIEINGGLVECVHSDVPVEYEVYDHDADLSDPEDKARYEEMEKLMNEMKF